jgi:phosphatidylglycerophosphate synthase
MFDHRVRQVLAPPLERAGAQLARLGVRPLVLTFTGWVVGIGACVAAATRLWPLALALWLGNRLLDGLDGPIARAVGATDCGGFLDIVADFSIYGGFVVGVAIGVPAARLACLALLLAYYVSGTAFLALSSLLERRRAQYGDERSLRFVGGLAEGTETVVVYVLFCVLPGHAALIAWIFTAAVAVTAVQRVITGAALLRAPKPSASYPTATPPVPCPPREAVRHAQRSRSR